MVVRILGLERKMFPYLKVEALSLCSGAPIFCLEMQLCKDVMPF
jgi:hypothetical protein